MNNFQEQFCNVILLPYDAHLGLKQILQKLFKNTILQKISPLYIRRKNVLLLSSLRKRINYLMLVQCFFKYDSSPLFITFKLGSTDEYIRNFK